MRNLKLRVQAETTGAASVSQDYVILGETGAEKVHFSVLLSLGQQNQNHAPPFLPFAAQQHHLWHPSSFASTVIVSQTRGRKADRRRASLLSRSCRLVDPIANAAMFDFGLVIRHPLFLATYIVAIPAWIVAFAGQCAAEAKYSSQSLVLLQCGSAPCDSATESDSHHWAI